MIFFKQYVGTCVFIFGLILSNISYASNSFSCAGTIDSIGVHGTDRVMLKLSGMNTVAQICNVSSSLGVHYPISAEQCKLAYSTLLAAYAMNKTMKVYFDNVVTGTGCSTIKSWEVATARYVALTKD